MDITISCLFLVLNIGLVSLTIGDNVDHWKVNFLADPLYSVNRMSLNKSVPYIDGEKTENALFLLTIVERNHSKLNEDISDSAEVKAYILSHTVKEAHGNSSMEYSIMAAAPMGSLEKLQTNAQATLKLCDRTGTCIGVGADLTIRKKPPNIWEDVYYVIVALSVVGMIWMFWN